MVRGHNFQIIREPRLLIHLTTSQSERRRRRRQQSVEITSQVRYSSLEAGVLTLFPPSLPLVKPCATDAGGTRMICEAPPIDPDFFFGRRLSATLGLQLDGVRSLRRIDNYTVTLLMNPSFKSFGKRSFSNTDTIRLTIESTVWTMM